MKENLACEGPAGTAKPPGSHSFALMTLKGVIEDLHAKGEFDPAKLVEFRTLLELCAKLEHEERVNVDLKLLTERIVRLERTVSALSGYTADLRQPMMANDGSGAKRRLI